MHKYVSKREWHAVWKGWPLYIRVWCEAKFCVEDVGGGSLSVKVYMPKHEWHVA